MDPQLEEDVGVIVGGGFAVDHLGPDAFEALAARARRGATAYARALARAHLGERFDPRAFSSLFPVVLLDLVRDGDPRGARAVATEARRQVHHALLVFDLAPDRVLAALGEDDANLVRRLLQLRSDLDAFLAR